MKGYVICQETLCGVVIDWLTNEDGTESPDLYADPREAAQDILDQRIEFIRSRFDNLGDLDADDLDGANGEAGDDLDLWIEGCTIEGEGASATIQLDCWDMPVRLGLFHRDNGRNDSVRWPPLDSPQGGVQNTSVRSSMEG